MLKLDLNVWPTLNSSNFKANFRNQECSSIYISTWKNTQSHYCITINILVANALNTKNTISNKTISQRLTVFFSFLAGQNYFTHTYVIFLFRILGMTPLES